MNLNRAMYYVLIVGMFVSSAFFAFGIVLFLIENPGSSGVLTQYGSVAQFAQDLGALRAPAILTLATIVLLATPISRVIVSILVFSINKEKRFVAVTTIVFLVIVSSLLLGYFAHFTPA